MFMGKRYFLFGIICYNDVVIEKKTFSVYNKTKIM